MLRLKVMIAVPVALIVVLFALAGCSGLSARSDATALKVMTYNVYVGAAPEELLNAPSQAEILKAVARFYQGYVASDFTGRAAAIAKTVKESQPHVIGLQEISLVRKQDPADWLTNRAPNAETVDLDFLDVLLKALKAEGLNYREAGKVATFDLEMPMLTATGLVDIRLTDHDVILVRSDVMVDSEPQSAKYQAKLSFANLGITVPRGYVAIGATFGTVKYRIVNTHLEHFEPAIRALQTQELIASLSDETRPVILMGDFNTEAPEGAAYQLLTGAGYEDVWQTDSAGSGNTCCQAGNLKNAISALDKRIDQIFIKGVKLRPTGSIRTLTVGDKQEDRLASGLWPSDHAGVVAYLPIE